MAMVRKQVGLQVKAAGLKDRQLKFVISTNRVDRAGDTIDQQGWQLADFKANPVITWGHQYDIPPIARAAQIGLEGGQLTSVAEFPEPGIYPLADQVYGLAKAGFINAASVGFEPITWSYNESRGVSARDYKQQALYEWAIVSIPSNPDTLIQARSQGLTWPGHGGPMRDGELIDVDEAMVREAVRAFVQAAMMQVTGRLDAGAPPRPPRPVARSEDYLELADEPTPSTRWEALKRLGYTYEAIGKMYQAAGVSNARQARLAWRQGA